MVFIRLLDNPCHLRRDESARRADDRSQINR